MAILVKAMNCSYVRDPSGHVLPESRKKVRKKSLFPTILLRLAELRS